MKRRNFFKGVFGTVVATLVPRLAKAEPPTSAAPDGSVSLGVIANGPFVSAVNVLKINPGRLYATVRVKIGEKVIDFNHYGDVGKDLQDAKRFMKSSGYQQWILTSSIKKALEYPNA